MGKVKYQEVEETKAETDLKSLYNHQMKAHMHEKQLRRHQNQAIDAQHKPKGKAAWKVLPDKIVVSDAEALAQI